jgi:hypothetical protein
MGTTDVLCSSIETTHDQLAERLGAARSVRAHPDNPREPYQRIDTFLCAASQHLHAVDAVLLRPARRRCDEGGPLVHGYLRSARDLEVLLAHVKAHEYGSVFEHTVAWSDVWSDLGDALGEHRQQELRLGERLTEALPDPELERIAERLQDAELAAPSRPHPYTPHTGLLGIVARRVMSTADRCWDTLENRMVPERDHEPKKRPGLVAQYFLADPRFDEEDQPTS